MEFFGLTYYGPQNYIKDAMKEYYKEPEKKEDVPALMEKVDANSTCPRNFQRPDIETVRVLDIYIGRVNGFAYGSSQRFNRMKKKGVIKPTGPADMFRLPATTYMEVGWFQCDPALSNASWYQIHPRYPQPMSPNTKILDVVRKNDKYASLY